MSTTIIHGRSNYFRVKDEAAFAAFCKQHNIETWSDTNDDHPGDTFHAVSPGDNGWPNSVEDPKDPDDFIDFDFEEELSKHLDPRDVAILTDVSLGKGHNVDAYASAIHPDGRVLRLGLVEHIYTMAQTAFGEEMNYADNIN